MKTAFCILLIFSLAACQKEIHFPPSISVKEVPEQIFYREEPNQEVMMRDFAPMIYGDKRYRISEYYSLKENLWMQLPFWIKDDIFIFTGAGQALVEANKFQHPNISFDIREAKWKLYADELGIQLDWLDNEYNFKTYTVVAYENEKSFTLCSRINDSKVYFTYSLIVE